MVRSPGNRWQIRVLEEPEKSKVLFIVGFMASGKSTLCRELGKRWNRPVMDTDSYIEQTFGLSIRKIFELRGEEEFRKLETECVHSIDPNQELIVSCGGGLPCFNHNMHLLRSKGTVWWLQTPFDEMFQRMSQSTERPVALQLLRSGGQQLLLQRYINRQACYRRSHAIITRRKPGA